MASISRIQGKSGATYKALVRIKKDGEIVSQSKSFRTKAEAVQWARHAEIELDQSGFSIPSEKTFGDLLKRYQEAVSPAKRSGAWEVKRIRTLLRDPLAAVPLKNLSSRHIAQWRDRSQQRMSGETILRDINILNHACKVAIQEWHWLRQNPFQGVERPKGNPPRDRRVSNEEIEAIILAGGYAPDTYPETRIARTVAAFLFALETGMRQGEIAKLRPSDDHNQYVFVGEAKNGESRYVPLTRRAREILDQVHGDFKISADSISSLFTQKIKTKAAIAVPSIKTLHFHDSRGEALTRLARILPVLDLAKVSGHKDLKILLNTYYRVTPEELAMKINMAETNMDLQHNSPIRQK